jgi:hypothetical protein
MLVQAAKDEALDTFAEESESLKRLAALNQTLGEFAGEGTSSVTQDLIRAASQHILAQRNHNLDLGAVVQSERSWVTDMHAWRASKGTVFVTVADPLVLAPLSLLPDSPASCPLRYDVSQMLSRNNTPRGCWWFCAASAHVRSLTTTPCALATAAIQATGLPDASLHVFPLRVYHASRCATFPPRSPETATTTRRR